MDKNIRKFSTLDAMKAEEYRHWQSVPVCERLQAAWNITLEAYQLKGNI